MTAESEDLALVPIGFVRSRLTERKGAPRQGSEGAPAARIEVEPAFLPALHLLTTGDEAIVLTWLHQARRETLQVHPRGDRSSPLTGVFATRSPDRPNPIGLHRVRITRISGSILDVEPLEAIDGTPVVDIKPVLSRSEER